MVLLVAVLLRSLGDDVPPPKDLGNRPHDIAPPKQQGNKNNTRSKGYDASIQ